MSRVNVDDFRITEDGRTVVYSSRPKLPEKSAEIDREGLRGWRFDARAFPVRGARPQTPDADRFLASVDLEEGREREARADGARSEEQTSELQSLMRTSDAVFFLKQENIGSSIYASSYMLTL